MGSTQLLAQAGNTITFTDGLGTVTLNFAGEANGRNAYESSGAANGDLRIAWTGTRWEIGTALFSNVLYFSNYDVAPNPPDLATGNWQPVAFDDLQGLAGSGTQVITLEFPTTFDPFCDNLPTQTGLGGGIPTGGVYSGPGVIDDGNGLTFSFLPSSASAGVQTINYGDPNNMATTTIEVLATDIAMLTLPDMVFCDNAGVQMNLGGGTPAGGSYSGVGVTDAGDGMTFSFDPAAAGAGLVDITYTVDAAGGCGLSTAMGTLSVATAPMVTFVAPGPFAADAGNQPLNSGTPAGGFYSGNSVVNDGLGTTFFSPFFAGVGTHIITYTVTSADGCSSSATGDIVVEASTPADNVCDGATPIDALFGQAEGEAQTSTLFSNVGYSSEGDPAFGNECFFEGDGFVSTIWFTFTGDGNTYNLRTVECTAANYLSDTQAVLYTGPCDDLTAVDCSEDEDGVGGIFNINTNIQTEVGVVYRLLLDGFEDATGEFCLEVINQGPPH